MAKKMKEKIIINDTPLSSTTIGNIEHNKNNFGPLIIIFAIFIGVIYFAPTITSLLNPEVPDTTTVSNNANKTTTETNTKTTDTEIKKIAYQDNMTLSSDKLTIKNLTIKNGTLTYTVENTSDDYLNLDSHNYFLEFYQTDTIIYRIMLSKTTYKAKETKTFSILVSSTTINNVSLREISVDEYPSLNLKLDTNNVGILTCTKDTETLTYTFKKDALTAINDVYVVPSNASNFSDKLNEYQTLLNKFKTQTGYVTALNLTSDSLTASINIDSNNAKVNKSDNIAYYASGTNPGKISFELNASGYKCS
jgi:hypothetical protein